MNEGEKKVIKILEECRNQILERKPFTYSFIDIQWAIGEILYLYNRKKEEIKQLEQSLAEQLEEKQVYINILERKENEKEFKNIY